jgi:hypothetical protein
MSSLRHQVIGVIDTCKTVLARGKDLPPVDATTTQIASAILEQAKAELPNDKVLAAVKLEEPLSNCTWAGILSAMETVNHTLPISGAARRRPSGGRREAVAAPKIFAEKVAGL